MTNREAVDLDRLEAEFIEYNTANIRVGVLWTNATMHALLREARAAERMRERAEQAEARAEQMQKERDALQASLAILNAAGHYITRHDPKPGACFACGGTGRRDIGPAACAACDGSGLATEPSKGET